MLMAAKLWSFALARTRNGALDPPSPVDAVDEENRPACVLPNFTCTNLKSNPLVLR